MKLQSLRALCVVSLATGFLVSSARADGFTYQGRLTDGGEAAGGSYDFRYALYAVESGGSPVSALMTNENVTVTSGVFTTTLDVETGLFDGTAYWVELGVRAGDSTGEFTVLDPRQPLTPVPHAHYATSTGLAASASAVEAGAVTAEGVADGSLTAEKLASGEVVKSLNGLRDDVTLSAGANVSLSANGNDIEISAGGAFWQLGGNGGTVPGLNFLGTTDSQPLELRANNGRILRLEPASGAPNVIGGHGDNLVTAGRIGGTIGGGGEPGAANAVEADFATVGGGRGNVASGDNSVVGGGYFNVAGNTSAFVGAGANNEARGLDSVIGGGLSNFTYSIQTVVAGGFNNLATNNHATVGGGVNNIASGPGSTIAGGNGNLASLNDIAIGGGIFNRATNLNAVISGGRLNVAGGFGSVVGGGVENEALGSYAIVGGGFTNIAMAAYSVIGGGIQNVSTNSYGTVGGGFSNFVAGAMNTISGGGQNVTSNNYATVGGGRFNIAGGVSTVVGGGFDNQANAIDSSVGGGSFNHTSGPYSRIGGGTANIIDEEARYTTIAGGWGNQIRTQAHMATISGGRANLIDTNSGGSVVAGGFTNVVGTNANYSAIGGGARNLIHEGASYSVIAGGLLNIVSNDLLYATIGGGRTNIAGAAEATVAGGVLNKAFGFSSTIGGGGGHQASGAWATVPGGRDNNADANYSFAAGRQAKAVHSGAFVWADNVGVDFDSAAVNEFAVRAGGGVRFETGGAGMTLDGQPLVTGAHNHFGQSWSGDALAGLSVTTSRTGDFGIAGLHGQAGAGASIAYAVPSGVFGESDEGFGVLGTSLTSIGVNGVSRAESSFASGVLGRAESTNGRGVSGVAIADLGVTYGVHGTAVSPDGRGVYGLHEAVSGVQPGVEGATQSTSGNASGVIGRVISASPGGFSAGVRGINNGTGGSGIGVFGSHAGGGWGVNGTSVSGVGVRAESGTGNPLEAYAGFNRRFYVSNTGSVFADGPYSGAGADFAEMLPAHAGLEPGDVLVVADDGKLARSSSPYQESVLGVYSTSPGFLGGASEDDEESGKIPLAVVGVVPVKVSAENGPIRPGNLLTASATAGHAMRASSNPPSGTVIGKALEAHPSGVGVVQMLVVLQ